MAAPPRDPAANDLERVPVTAQAFELIGGEEVPIGKPRQTSLSRGALDQLLQEPQDPAAEPSPRKKAGIGREVEAVTTNFADALRRLGEGAYLDVEDQEQP